MSEANIRIGIGGWNYPPWRRTFYPDKLPHSKELEFASRAFGAIEINATFYGRQNPKSWSSWEKSVPDGFHFTVKGSRYVVTRPKLADAGEALSVYFGQGLTALREKLGPILWTLAARRTFDFDDIAGFLQLLPAKLDEIHIRHVIEPRHESFRDAKFFDLCRDHNVAIVYGDDDEFPRIEADTASFAYARLQRMSEDVPTGYEADELDRLAALALHWKAQRRDSYLFMINGAKIRAPAAALALQERVLV